jgi:hypothetical protein
MESHDEERVAYKGITWGNTGVRNWENLSSRISAAMAFHFLTPYPKMMWQGGELGDDRELTEEGRTDPKPFRWEDLNDENRKAIYDAASKIISFRTGHPELYGDGATNRLTTYNVNDADMGGKHMVYTSGNSTVMVAANFLTEGENPSTPGGGGGTTTVGGSLVYTDPAVVQANTTETVTVYVNTAGTAMAGFTGDLYAHTGVITNKSVDDTDWKYVKHEWTENADDCKLKNLGGDLWSLSITGGPRAFYGVPASEAIQKMAFVFRNADGTKEGKDNGNDIFVTVQGNQPAKVMAKAPTQFAIAVPNGTYTNLITEEDVVITGGLYNVSLEPHSYVVLVKTN